MRTHSIYTVECVCGHPIESETPETVCPKCGVQIVMIWGRDVKTVQG